MLIALESSRKQFVMRTLAFAFGITASLQLVSAQQPTQPATPPVQVPPTTAPRNPVNPVPAPSPEVPRSPGILPPGPGVNPTSPPTARSVSNTLPNIVQPQTGITPGIATPGLTNLQATNRLGFATNGGQRIFAVTNALASMSQAQVQNVVQVQNALNNLQNAAANIGRIQNVQQVIQQNPQMQQQLQQISTQISALAQGPVKPSIDIVQRLSSDLLFAFSRARVSPDAHLVIAVIINQACNSGRLSAVQVNELLDSALVTLQTSGVPTSAAHPVRCDLHSIAYELQPDLGS